MSEEVACSLGTACPWDFSPKERVRNVTGTWCHRILLGEVLPARRRLPGSKGGAAPADYAFSSKPLGFEAEPRQQCVTGRSPGTRQMTHGHATSSNAR